MAALYGPSADGRHLCRQVRQPRPPSKEPRSHYPPVKAPTRASRPRVGTGWLGTGGCWACPGSTVTSAPPQPAATPTDAGRGRPEPGSRGGRAGGRLEGHRGAPRARRAGEWTAGLRTRPARPGASFTPSAIRAGLHCAPGTSGSPKRPGLVTFLILNLVYFLFIFKN